MAQITLSAGSSTSVSITAGNWLLISGSGTYRVGPLGTSQRPSVDQLIDETTVVGPFSDVCPVTIFATGGGASYEMVAPTDAVGFNGKPAAVSGGGNPVSISGVPAVGQVLTAIVGSGWSITGGQWYRDATAISGATALTYTVVDADGGTLLAFVPTGLPFRAQASAAVPLAPPVADFSASVLTGQIPLTVNFTDTSTGGVAASYEWEFFGLGLVQSTQKNPSYTFREPGTYTVKMRAINAAGTSEKARSALITVTDKTYAARAASVSRFVEDVEDVMYQPNSERLAAANGTTVFDFTTADATTLTNCTSDLYAPTRWAPATQSRRLTATAAGGFTAIFPVAAQPVYDATKDLVFKFWVDDVAAINSFNVKLDNGAGNWNSQTWAMSGTGFKRGWNLFVLPGTNNTVANEVYSQLSGVAWIGTSQTGGMHNQPIRQVTIMLAASAAAAPIGTKFIPGTIEVASKVKPVLSITMDQTTELYNGQNVFTQLIMPMMAKYGLVGDARIHQQVTSYNAQDAIAAGWGYNNGTLSRATPITTKAQAISEYGTMNDRMTAAGLAPADFGAMPGHNNGMDASWGVQALIEMGYPKFLRGNAQRAIYHGVQGHNNRGNLFGVFSIDAGQTDVTQPKKYIDGMIAFGGHGCFFMHSTAAGWNAARAAYLEEVFAYVRTKVDAGQMDCLPLSGATGQRSMARALLGYI